MNGMDTDLEDILKKITYHHRKRIEYFLSLPLPTQSVVLRALSPHVRNQLIQVLSLEKLVEVLDHLDARDVHNILDHMKDGRRRARITSHLKNERFAKVEQFLQFHPQANSTLLQLNYVLIPKTKTIGETAQDIEEYIEKTGKVPEVLVADEGKLIGEIPLSALVQERNTSKLEKYVRTIHTLPYTAGKKDILTCFTHQPHTKVAVIDTDGSVLGLMYSDDVIELVEHTPAASLYSFAGVEESERPFDPTLHKVRHRYKWLILNLATAFLAAATVALFEDTLTQIVMLAIYMPIIAGMGSNAATQTLAVMVRGIAIGEISLKTARKALIQEVQAGFINGAIIGAIVALIAIVFNQDPLLGLVAGISVLASLVIAGFAGTLIPLILRYFGKDPATSATIFITTGIDVFGFLIFFGLATLILL